MDLGGQSSMISISLSGDLWDLLGRMRIEEEGEVLDLGDELSMVGVEGAEDFGLGFKP